MFNECHQRNIESNSKIQIAPSFTSRNLDKLTKDIYKHNVTTNKNKSTQGELIWRHSLETSIQHTAATQGSTTATNAQKKLAPHYNQH